jgi:hypothetical protein
MGCNPNTLVHILGAVHSWSGVAIRHVLRKLQGTHSFQVKGARISFYFTTYFILYFTTTQAFYFNLLQHMYLFYFTTTYIYYFTTNCVSFRYVFILFYCAVYFILLRNLFHFSSRLMWILKSRAPTAQVGETGLLSALSNGDGYHIIATPPIFINNINLCAEKKMTLGWVVNGGRGHAELQGDLIPGGYWVK